MDRDEAIRLLRGREDGVREWNQRRERGKEIPSLRWPGLMGVEGFVTAITGVVLSQVVRTWPDLILAAADLSRAGAAHIATADLSRADLSGAVLTGEVSNARRAPNYRRLWDSQ